MRLLNALALLGFSLWLGLPSVHAQAGTLPYKFNETPLPYHVTWGPYTVTVEGARNHPMTGRRVLIADRAGRVLREIDAYFIATVDFLALDGSGVKALHVVTEPDNNLLANRRTFCFSRRGRLHNVLAMPFGFDKLRDLDHDGQPELFGDNPALLEYADGVDLCHAAYPPVYLILRWNGTRYRLANRRFPAVVLAEVAEKKKRFLADIEEFGTPSDQLLSWDYLVGDAIGIWADLASIGRQCESRQWLLAHLPSKFVRGQFKEMLPSVRRSLVELPTRITTSQSRVIHTPVAVNDLDDDQS